MNPFKRDCVHKFGIRCCIGTTLFSPRTIFSFEYVLTQRSSIADDADDDGMDLNEVQDSIRTEQLSHHFRPWVEIGKPSECTYAGIDNVELTVAKRLPTVVHVGAYELGPQGAVSRKAVGNLDGRCREVEPYNSCSTTSPRQRVRTKVTLQVDKV